MNASRNITTRGYLITTRANNTTAGMAGTYPYHCLARRYAAAVPCQPAQLFVAYSNLSHIRADSIPARPTLPADRAEVEKLHSAIRQNLEALGHGE